MLEGPDQGMAPSRGDGSSVPSISGESTSPREPLGPTLPGWDRRRRSRTAGRRMSAGSRPRARGISGRNPGKSPSFTLGSCTLSTSPRQIEQVHSGSWSRTRSDAGSATPRRLRAYSSMVSRWACISSWLSSASVTLDLKDRNRLLRFFGPAPCEGPRSGESRPASLAPICPCRWRRTRAAFPRERGGARRARRREWRRSAFREG